MVSTVSSVGCDSDGATLTWGSAFDSVGHATPCSFMFIQYPMFPHMQDPESERAKGGMATRMKIEVGRHTDVRTQSMVYTVN